MRRRFLSAAAALLLRSFAFGAAATTPWADWIEPDFPFFSSVVDARHAGAAFPTNNLTPRGLVLNLGRDIWVCFDPDLLRVSAVWQGKALSPRALAAGSYKNPDRKTPAGQFPAPEPVGSVWLANGIYPGWQAGTQLAFTDPRALAPSPEEVGRGPIAEAMGRFNAVRLTRTGAVLEYTAGGADVREWMTLSEQDSQPVIERQFHVGPSGQSLVLVLGFSAPEAAMSLGRSGDVSPVLEGIPVVYQNGLAIDSKPKSDNGSAKVAGAAKPPAMLPPLSAKVWTVRLPAHRAAVDFCVALAAGRPAPTVAPRVIPTEAPSRRWPQEVTSRVKPSTAQDSYVVDDIPLPLDNPWRRDLRIGDLQFLKDGTGVGVTLDGDVWTVRGLADSAGLVRWRRFASGLHEPMTVAIRDEQIYVFDRNGIWRLRDTNGDGEADVHELFSNAFGQTADMREFPSSLRLAPGGEFVIAKGGQQATTEGRHNGSILRISADGRRATLLGYGFRQPNLGVNLRTGLVLASDQQGPYVPSTPLDIVRDGQFYGFLSPMQPREKYPAPIADPLTWIPHSVDASSIALLWLFGAKMGPLSDELVHIGFNKPELFRVLLNHRGRKPQAAVVSVTHAFDFPTLNGAVNPADGQLYVAGFQILGWGTTATRAAGLGRVRYTGAPCTLPREVVPMDQGVLLRFDLPLDARQAANPASYTLASWHYVRTYKYGSPQLKADEKPGMDWLAASSAYLSKDRRSVFVGVAGMKPVMQMRIGWSLATAAGARFEENAYFTPYDLPKFDPAAEGFGALTVDLTPRAVAAQAAGPVTVAEGARLYQLFGCVACHSNDNVSYAKIGPPWRGLYGRERVFGNDIGPVVADEAYLRESILEPAAKITPGFEKAEAGMPSFAGVLTDSQIEALILYIKSLK